MSPWYLFLELIIFLYLLEYKPESNELQTWMLENIYDQRYKYTIHYSIHSLNCWGG